MIANKTLCGISQSLTFLLWRFIEAVLVTFVAIVFFRVKLLAGLHGQVFNSQAMYKFKIKLL